MRWRVEKGDVLGWTPYTERYNYFPLQIYNYGYLRITAVHTITICSHWPMIVPR